MVKVWCQRDKNPAEKVKTRPDSNVNDLKEEIFGKTDKGKYQATYKGQVLRPSAKIPPNTTADMPMVFTKIGDEPTPESQEFVAFGMCEILECEGRPCIKCNKCRDWHFRGNQDQWNWVCDWKNWKGDDKKRWCDDDWKLLVKRDDATCTVATAAADRDDDADYLAYIADLRAIYLAEDARDDDDNDRRAYLEYLSNARYRRDGLYLDYLADRVHCDDDIVGHLCLCEKY